MSDLVFAPAQPRARYLKLGIQGPAGSGKTDGALALATALAAGGRVACVDTENRSSELFAHRYHFALLDLKPPFTSARYEAAIQAAVDQGFAAIVVDSLSHQWAGLGGILERQGHAARGSGNAFTAWQPFTKEHEAFKAFLLNAPVHLVCTLRTKTEYVIEKDERGRSVPKRLGTKAIQRDGLEYEFTATIELQTTKRGTSSKDRTEVLGGELNLRDPALGARLQLWTRGDAATPSAAPTPTPADAPAVELTRDTPFPGDHTGRMKGIALKDWPLEMLRWAVKSQPSFFEASELNTSWLLAIQTEFRERSAQKAS